MPSDQDELVVTPLDQWKGVAVEGNVIPLPSGNNVRVKRTMDLLDLLKQGRIPNPLGAMVQKMVSGEQKEIMPTDLSPDAVVDMMKLVDETVVRCVTQPKVQAPPDPEDGEEADAYRARVNAWTPDEGCAPLSFFTIEDRMYIFVYAQGFAGDLATFREETSTAMARLSDGKPVPAKTKRTGRGK